MASVISYFALSFFSWCACICAIIYLFDLLTKRLKHKREVAMYVLFIQSYLTQIAAVLIVLIITPWVSLFTYLFRAFSINLIFQKTACSKSQMHLVPLAMMKHWFSMLCSLCWWVSTCQSQVCLSSIVSICPALNALKLFESYIAELLL